MNENKKSTLGKFMFSISLQFYIFPILSSSSAGFMMFAHKTNTFNFICAENKREKKRWKSDFFCMLFTGMFIVPL
jgi:hypothetical protein